ncbi:putative immunity protein [Actinoplanes sp. DH11]|uniref:putative immunity protein n=1 Tax=Actinoplanes sp. DH11 TaxID=2857011 RepID=UPI001E54B303|nr:exonuclease SbcC [Actinoplanes sp. DH11]
MADDNAPIDLSTADLRAVAGYAADCAEPALKIFERVRADDRRPNDAVRAARAFAAGAPRTKVIRDCAWAAQRAYQETRDAGQAAASEAARAAVAAASAAFLHPLAKSTQVLHILGAAAHTAAAFELDAGGDRAAGAAWIVRARDLAGPVLVDVLKRYPEPPGGRGRAGELLRDLDAALRRPDAG